MSASIRGIALVRQVPRTTNSRHTLKFASRDGVAFFERISWQAKDIRATFHEATRLRRLPLIMRPFALLPEPDPRCPGGARWAAIVRFERG